MRYMHKIIEIRDEQVISHETDKNVEGGRRPPAANSTHFRRIRTLLVPVLLSAHIIGCTPLQTDDTQRCYAYTGVYDPTPNYDDPNNYSGDEFYSTARTCIPRNESPDIYTCPASAVRRRFYSVKPALVITTRGTLIPGSCVVTEEK